MKGRINQFTPRRGHIVHKVQNALWSKEVKQGKHFVFGRNELRSLSTSMKCFNFDGLFYRKRTKNLVVFQQKHNNRFISLDLKACKFQSVCSLYDFNQLTSHVRVLKFGVFIQNIYLRQIIEKLLFRRLKFKLEDKTHFSRILRPNA